MEQNNLILTQAEKVFLTRGFKNVTMDDIASALGMSKKTLYVHYENKADLIQSLITHHITIEKESCTKIFATVTNAIHQILAIENLNSEMMRSLNPISIFELQKYYPLAWNLIVDYKEVFIFEGVVANIKLGQEQKLYREDLVPELIAKLHVGAIDSLFQSASSFKKMNMEQVFMQYFTYHLRGISTDKGIKYLDKIKFQ
jgi:TetR/AcrR family transcriptional regulator, cholesterol catabolism regulator